MKDNRPTLRTTLARCSLLVALGCGPTPCPADELFTAFQDPPPRLRPFVRWWWNGGCVTEGEVLRELNLLAAAGIGGVEINTIAMPERTNPETFEDVRCLEWLGPEWNRVVRAVAEGARERGMTADLIVGSGWPFGGRFLEGAERTQRVRLAKRAVEGPEGKSWLWPDHDRILPSSTVVDRYVSSAARLSGKWLISYEAMTNAVPVFRAVPADLKRLYDMSLLTGVLHPVIHGFNYSPREAGFPGWVRFGTWLNEQNPWWPHLRRFTDYAARLTTVLASSDGQADVALLGPKADEWARHRRFYQPFPEVAVPWYHYALGDALAQAGHGSDFVNELEVEITTSVANYTRSRRDNPAARRWAFWFPPIPSGLPGPVRLVSTAP